MALKIYNTLTRSVEEFVPLDPVGKQVGMYCCGPTVHDYAHIGNFRTFAFADLVRRFLTSQGFNVHHVMNITDVEDKIIKRVRNSNGSLRDYTKKFEDAFTEDLKTLGCHTAQSIPRATEHIPEIIDLVERLLKKGFAYVADGSVYFNIEKYRSGGHQYGQLLNLNFEQMRSGERVKSDEYEKESVADFALWKARTPDDGEVFWGSPWGEGRPGWHIECSAMSMKILSPSFDLHLGGEDLIFPHHEDEIAQSEGAGLQAHGHRFVKYWMHGAHLLVEGKKMSKSLGNYFTLRDLLDKGFTGREVRYLLLSSHYRAPFNFTLEGLTAARSALSRVDECLGKLREIAGDRTGDVPQALLVPFETALQNDLNVADAWSVVFDWVRSVNKALAAGPIPPLDAAGHLGFWTSVNAIFNVGLEVIQNEIPIEILELLNQRQEARKSKDFKKSDQIRNELQSLGWTIEDTPKGPKLKKL